LFLFSFFRALRGKTKTNEKHHKKHMKSTNTLSEAERRRGLIALLTDVFCMYTGFFMVVPLISVHYVDGLGWAAASIGLVLALRQVTQQGLTLFGGVLADQIGAKLLICCGLAVRIVGFVVMAWATTLPLLFLSAVLSAVGGALFESPRAAAIAALTRPDERQRFYSLAGVLGAIGMAIGPLLGALLLRVDFTVVALVGAACFSVNLVQTIFMLPAVRVATAPGRLGDGLGLVLRDRPFVTYIVLLMGYWFMWVQLSISLPLEAQQLSGTSDSVSLIYAVNAGLTILLQYPLLRVLTPRARPLTLLAIGVALMSMGLGGVALAHGIAGLVACVVVFSLGSLLVQPTQQTVTASMANQSALGSYFGVSSLALALGGGLGNYSGGLLYGLGGELAMPALPWVVFCAVGLVAALGLALLRRRQGSVRPPVGEPAVAAQGQQ
jgi:DHA1 family multidrug resistance protein-like MFS transporter